MRTHGTPIFFAATCILAALGPSCDSPTQRTLTNAPHEAPDDPQIHAEVLRLIQEHYFQPVNPDTSLTARNIVSHLDPFSRYVTHAGYNQDMQRFNDEGYRYGVGLKATGRHIILTSVVTGSAADEAGLLPGDELVAISNRALNGDESLAFKMLFGSESAEFGILRGNAKRMSRIWVQKATCEESSVPLAVMFDSEIGYVAITGFHNGTTAKLHKAVEYLTRHGMRSLIIDLRWNPGGFVREALSALNLFVHSDSAVIRETSRHEGIGCEDTLSGLAAYPSLPLVVLVGNYTCSAAELFSGVLQDLDRAIIVGQLTIGKSLVMQYYPLSNGDQLYLTVAQYSLPSGRTIQRPYFAGRLIGGQYRDFGSFNDSSHAIDADLAESDCPIYQTRSGRTVTGSTGLVPDYFVAQEMSEPEWLSDAEESASASYIRANAEWLLSTTLRDFTLNGDIPDNLLEGVLNQVKAHDTTEAKLTSSERAWKVTKDIKARVAFDIWEERGYFHAEMRNTAAIRRAAALLMKANTLALTGKE